MSGIVVEASHGHDREPSNSVQERKARTAHTAENVGEPSSFGQLVGLEVILAVGVAERLKRDKEIRSEGSSPDFPAPLTMAVVRPSGLGCDFVADRAAKTAACDLLELHAAVQGIGLQLQRTALTVNAETQGPDGRMLPRIDWINLFVSSCKPLLDGGRL